jgi:hypothetical protein
VVSRKAIVAALLVLLAGVAPARAVTQLQGFYQAFAQAGWQDETWQFHTPNHFLELRVLATPWTNVEAFAEVSANANRFRTVNPGVDAGTDEEDADRNLPSTTQHQPRIFFSEGHARWRQKHAEVIAFSGQNRFWFSQPLLNVVDGNTLQDYRDGPRSQAIRADFWDLAGFGGLTYWGDKPSNGEDFVAGRITQNYSNRRVVLGGTYGRLDTGSGSSDYAMTGAVDFELALGELFGFANELGRTAWVVEAGRNFSGGLKAEDHLRNGFQTELRELHVQKITFKGQAWYREPAFYTALSGREGDDDRKGYFVEAWWRLPKKQVDIRYAHWRSRAFQELGNDEKIFDQREHDLEFYLELKGGFSSWIKYRNFKGNEDPVYGGRFENVVFELQGQNKLISVRPQVRFRDFGTRVATAGYGMEINLNITSKWKIFGRFLNANEQNESRSTAFMQARYNAWSNAEFFLEYGDGGRSDRLTENDSFVGEGQNAPDLKNDRRIQLIMRVWF